MIFFFIVGRHNLCHTRSKNPPEVVASNLFGADKQGKVAAAFWQKRKIRKITTNCATPKSLKRYYLFLKQSVVGDVVVGLVGGVCWGKN